MMLIYQIKENKKKWSLLFYELYFSGKRESDERKCMGLS